MNAEADATEFFTVGGTLPPESPSYVSRSADTELFKTIMSGQLCYVLTSRQMGKSSLMLQTVRRLNEVQVSTVIIDLAAIGRQVTPGQWYLSIIDRLIRQLKLPVETMQWWSEHTLLDPVRCFADFIHDVVLRLIKGQIVVFIDEIDKILDLDFRDDFFASILAMYNARGFEPAYQRLTFVLLGLATPMELINVRERTSFNIGKRIQLQEFSFDDVSPLRQGLEEFHPRQGDRILKRILYWTNGHPYLTQRLCLAAASTNETVWDDTKIDDLTASIFFSDEARTDSNLTFVRDRLRSVPHDKRQELLALYRDVYDGKSVSDGDYPQTQLYLELMGLVRVEQRRLWIRNEIYRHVFNDTWIIEQLQIVSPEGTRTTWPHQLTTARTAKSFLLFAATAILTITLLVAGGYALAHQAGIITNIPTTAIVSQPTMISVKQCRVKAEITILDGPGANYKPIGKLDPEAPVAPSKRTPDGSWLQVFSSADSQTEGGWVSANSTRISCDFDLSILPVYISSLSSANTSAPLLVNASTLSPAVTQISSLASTPTSLPVICRVVHTVGVSVKSRPGTDGMTVGSLSTGAVFTPSAKSTNDNRFVWVRVSSSGWVYAGASGVQLVSCTGLETVPISLQ